MNGKAPSTSLRRRLVAFSAGHGTIVDVIGLMLCALIVHGFYVLYIDPLAGDAIRTAEATATVPERSLAVILKDIEQEICIVLGLWSAWLLAFRYRLFENEGYLLEVDFLDLGTVDEYSQPVLAGLHRKVADASARVPGSLLLSSIGLALDRIRLNGAFHEANEVAAEACDLHLEMLHSKLAINRYVLWAIPSIGFLGTVRGIGEALTRAGEAMAGDISGVAREPRHRLQFNVRGALRKPGPHALLQHAAGPGGAPGRRLQALRLRAAHRPAQRAGQVVRGRGNRRCPAIAPERARNGVKRPFQPRAAPGFRARLSRCALLRPRLGGAAVADRQARPGGGGVDGPGLH